MKLIALLSVNATIFQLAAYFYTIPKVVKISNKIQTTYRHGLSTEIKISHIF